MPGHREWSSKPWTGVRPSTRNPLANGLRGLWAFNEDGGNTVFNLAQANYPATLSGATPPSWANSPYGRALTFNGSSSYIASVGTVADFNFLASTAIFTLAARIRLANNAADAAGTIWGGTANTGNKDLAFFWENRSVVSSPKALRLILGGGVSTQQTLGAQTVNNVITDNNWHHVAAVGNVNTTAIYVDGVAVGLSSNTSLTTPAGPLTAAPDIGRLNSGLLFFNGDIEHVMVWDRVLTADEIRVLYGNPYQVFSSRYRRTPLAGTTTYFLWNSEVEENFNVLTY